VERRVAIGLVRPFTERPVSGVWLRVSSLPVPPLRGRPAALFAAFFFDAGLLRDGPAVRRLEAVVARFRERSEVFLAVLADLVFLRGVAVLLREAGFPDFLRAGVLAPAVFRRPPLLRAIARTPAPALPLDGVRVCPLFFARFFLAINASFSLPAPAGWFDRTALTVVSSIAYRNSLLSTSTARRS
jgi:hypothetical protein